MSQARLAAREGGVLLHFVAGVELNTGRASRGKRALPLLRYFYILHAASFHFISLDPLVAVVGQREGGRKEGPAVYSIMVNPCALLPGWLDVRPCLQPES